MGTFQLEYDNSRHDHMEIEIADESPEAEVFTVKFNGEEEYGYIPASADAINDKVLDFYG